MVGPRVLEENLAKLADEGARRYKAGTPPGFMDADKPGERRRFGDFFIWRQLIERARDTSRPILFITDDRKEDWWRRIAGKNTGPLPSLRAEMMDEAKQAFYMYTSSQFLKVGAQPFLKRKANEDALVDAERVSRAEEEAIESRTQLAELFNATRQLDNQRSERDVSNSNQVFSGMSPDRQELRRMSEALASTQTPEWLKITEAVKATYTPELLKITEAMKASQTPEWLKIISETPGLATKTRKRKSPAPKSASAKESNAKDSSAENPGKGEVSK